MDFARTYARTFVGLALALSLSGMTALGRSWGELFADRDLEALAAVLGLVLAVLLGVKVATLAVRFLGTVTACLFAGVLIEVFVRHPPFFFL